MMILREIDSDTYFQESLASLRLSKYDEAVKSIDLAILNSSNKNFYMFQKAKILFVARMFAKCSHYIEDNLISFYDNSSRYIFSQILYYYQAATDCPISHLSHLLVTHDIPSILAHIYKEFINNPKINLLEIIIYSQEAGDYPSCIDYCELLLSKDPSNTTAHLIMARCYCLLGQYDAGITTYRNIIRLHPDVPSIYIELGKVMAGLKHYREATHYFEKALDIDPSNPELMTQLGDGYLLRRKYDRALASFKQALSKKPDCPETLLRIASTYDRTDRPRRAKKYYNRRQKLKSFS